MKLKWFKDKKKYKKALQFKHPEMTREEFAHCRPAAEVDTLQAPIPTHLVSNEEYFPPSTQTQQQKEIEARVRELTDKGAKKLGISRRQFLSTTCGMAACLVAMNEVFRKSAFGADLFNVSKDAMYDKDAFVADGPPADLFVFDDQTHIVRGQAEMGHIGSLLRALAQGETARFPNSPFPFNPFNEEGNPDELGHPWSNWNPRLINRTNYDASEYWLHNYIKYHYFESQTTVSLISNVTLAVALGVPGVAALASTRASEILTAQQTAASRDFINSISGSTRALAHGLMYMGAGNVPYLQEQVDRFQPDSWKGYQTPSARRDENSGYETWTFDDEELAFPTFEFIRDNYRKNGRQKPGQNCVCVHKGLDDSSRPADIPVAAAAFPELNFIIYHSCIRPGFFMYPAWQDLQSGRMREGVPDILDTTEFAQTLAPFGNVYAELGTFWASQCVTFPTVALHTMGQLFKYFGADRIIWGTDSMWYGSPQWQIETFWRFQIPEELRQKYCYPEITLEMKRKVLGLNAARLYGLSPDLKKYKTVPIDYYNRMTGDAGLMRIMEYDNRLPNETIARAEPAPSPYGVATAQRNDRMELLRSYYRQMVGTKHGVPTTNVRHGWIRVR